MSGRVGKTLAGVSLLAYQLGDEVETDDIALELAFSDETVVLLDGAGDGERPRVDVGAWVDPFEGPSPENAAYVRAHGKRIRLDRSNDAHYGSLVGKVLMNVDLLLNEFGTPAGFALDFETDVLWFWVRCDDCQVGFAQPIGYRRVKLLA